MRHVAGLLIALCGVVPACAESSYREDSVDVAVAAVRHLRDPDLAMSAAVKPSGSNIDPQVEQAVRSELGAQTLDEARTRYCGWETKAEPPCINVIVSIHDLEVCSRTAMITVRADYPPGPDSTAYFSHWTLALTKQGGDWTVDRVIDRELY